MVPLFLHLCPGACQGVNGHAGEKEGRRRAQGLMAARLVRKGRFQGSNCVLGYERLDEKKSAGFEANLIRSIYAACVQMQGF